MNEQDLENKLTELERKITQIKKELSMPESKMIKPEYCDKYYYIADDGEIIQSFWTGNTMGYKRYAIHNCFKTREEAEFEVERRKVIAELERFAEEHNEPMHWNDITQFKWYINYTYCVGYERVYIESNYTLRHNDIYFSSEELAKQAVAKVGEERIKKYYLGVE